MVVVVISAAIFISGCIMESTNKTGSKYEDGSGHIDGDNWSAVGKITTIVERQAKTVDWSPLNSRIVFGKWGVDGYVDVYVMNPDGSEQECLTCNKYRMSSETQR